MIIKKYDKEEQDKWNDYLSLCKNNHFIFNRQYMEYHEDRFVDHSLMIFDNKEKLVALFPANEVGDEVHSHQGLTFGGVLSDNKITTKNMMDIFHSIKEYYNSKGFKKVYYKSIPYIYSSLPAEEDRYALFRLDASLYRRDVSTTIYMENKLPYQTLRKRMIKKAKKEKFDIYEEMEFSKFFDLLTEVLRLEHNVTPVHTLTEMNRLKELFPKNIRCHCIGVNESVIAGIIVFSNEDIAHCQYIAANSEARKSGALDFLIDELINETYMDKKYFDFGTSNENSGLILNEGLIFQKEGFGARAVVHDFYEFDIND